MPVSVLKENPKIVSPKEWGASKSSTVKSKFLDVSNLQWELVKSKLIFRWEKAVQAFRRSLESVSRETLARPIDSKAIVGWLYPADESSEFKNYELATGLNYFETGDAMKISQKLTENPANAVKLSVGLAKVEIRKETQLKSYFHGDEVILGDKSFRLALLSARTIGKYFLSLLLILPLMGRMLYAAENAKKAEAKSVEISDLVGAKASTRNYFERSFGIPGLSSIQEDRVQIYLQSAQKQINLSNFKVRRENPHFIFLVDTSSLCTQRGMEPLINQELKEFVGRLNSKVLVSLAEFYHPENSPEVFTTLFSNVDANSLKERAQFLHCRTDAHSTNALEAILRLQKELIQGPENDGRRNVVFLITSGNVKESAAAEKIIRQNSLQIIAVNYARTQTEYAAQVLSPLVAVNQGLLLKWDQASALHLVQKYPFRWTFRIRADLPLSVESKSYPLEIQYPTETQNFLIHSSLQYKMDPSNALYYKIWIGFLIFLSFLALAAVIYLLVRYYRTPFCPHDQRALSRSWNSCLFCARGRYPVISVETPTGYERSYVVAKNQIKVGSGFLSDLRLKAKSGFSIRRKAPKTYEINPDQNCDALLNDQSLRSASFLKSGDQISIGNYKLQFLFDTKENAA